MKKILVTMTLAAFVFGALTLAGCGKKKEESSSSTTTETTTSTTTDSSSMSTPAMMDSSSMAPMDSTKK